MQQEQEQEVTLNDREIKLNGRPYTYKKATIGQLDRVMKYERQRPEFFTNQFFQHVHEPGFIEKYQEAWSAYCDILFESPDEYVKNVDNWTLEEINTVVQGFFLVAMTKRKSRTSSPDSSKGS